MARTGRKPTARGPWYDSVFARNLRRLIDYQADGIVLAWCQARGLNQSSINRIQSGQRDTLLGTVEEIAAATRYKAWQLLHPDFDPRLQPPMMDPRAMRVAAIFASLTSPLERDRLEAIAEQFEPVQSGHED